MAFDLGISQDRPPFSFSGEEKLYLEFLIAINHNWIKLWNFNTFILCAKKWEASMEAAHLSYAGNIVFKEYVRCCTNIPQNHLPSCIYLSHSPSASASLQHLSTLILLTLSLQTVLLPLVLGKWKYTVSEIKCSIFNST